MVLNLGGGHEDFLRLAARLGLPDAADWVLGRPAVHPMRELADYFRAADVVCQASLEEGLSLATIEGLACGVPVVASEVGGMAVRLRGHALLTPRRDVDAMAEVYFQIARDPEKARALEHSPVCERMTPNRWPSAFGLIGTARRFAGRRRRS